jgi:predicted RNA binding protein YcfA (HicA-like mRNA interferase family)
MRRSELEQRLRDLGWQPTQQASGVRHERWAHPRRRGTIAVPNEELVINAVAEAILIEAEG